MLVKLSQFRLSSPCCCCCLSQLLSVVVVACCCCCGCCCCRFVKTCKTREKQSQMEMIYHFTHFIYDCDLINFATWHKSQFPKCNYKCKCSSLSVCVCICVFVYCKIGKVFCSNLKVFFTLFLSLAKRILL